LGEPLGQALRIPCYRGSGLMRLTYRGLGRPIRGVVQVARSVGATAVGNRRLAQRRSGYRYSNGVASGASLKALNVLLRSDRSTRVNA
jgi:hypothetical protein